MTAVWIILAFLTGGFCGMVIGAMLAAAGRADDRATSMGCYPAAELARDFHVVYDADGTEHLVPVEASPPPAAEDNPPDSG